jgi:hypothetical protein
MIPETSVDVTGIEHQLALCQSILPTHITVKQISHNFEKNSTINSWTIGRY